MGYIQKLTFPLQDWQIDYDLDLSERCVDIPSPVWTLPQVSCK